VCAGKLGLQLFNFDLIRSGPEERFCVVDINHFPGLPRCLATSTSCRTFLSA